MEMLTVIVDRNSRVSNHIIGYPKEGKIVGGNEIDLSTKNFPEVREDQSISQRSPDVHLFFNKLEGLEALAHIFNSAPKLTGSCSL